MPKKNPQPSKALPKLPVAPKELPRRILRHRTLNLRCTEVEREQIHAAARLLGITITDYLLGLHAQAWEQMQKGQV